MKNYKAVKYCVLGVSALGLASVVYTSSQKNQKFLDEKPFVSVAPTDVRIPGPVLPRQGKISEDDQKLHDISGSPTSITESGKVTGFLPPGKPLVTSPSLGVEFIAPSGHSLKTGDAVCITFQRFPSGAIANLTLTEGACEK